MVAAHVTAGPSQEKRIPLPIKEGKISWTQRAQSPSGHPPAEKGPYMAEKGRKKGGFPRLDPDLGEATKGNGTPKL